MADMGVGEAMLLSSIIGGGASLAGGALAPQGQHVNSFGGEAPAMLQQFKQQYGNLQNRIANQTFDLAGAEAPASPTFTGGGLPMPIGLTGRDPARTNPDILRRGAAPTMGLTPTTGTPGPGGGSSAPGVPDPPSHVVDSPVRRGPNREMGLSSGNDLMDAQSALHILRANRA